MPTAEPPRQLRRRLVRRANKLLQRLGGTPISLGDATPLTHCVLAGERSAPLVVRRDSLIPAARACGLWVIGLPEALADIAAAPQNDGIRYPVLILIEGWAQCAWIRFQPLAKGGVA
jgi:hypothetical protein